jgi:AcrR family transcriptional regulator
VSLVSTPTLTTGPLRRVPVQGRSVARVQRMLDACAALVDEVGYDGLSTTLLAERAGVAIGSVYQFFPDKRAIVQALTLRNLEAYLQRLGGRFREVAFDHWWAGVDAAIDEYIAMHRSVPGFRTLHFGDVVDMHLLDEDQDNNGVIADQIARLLMEQFGEFASRTGELSGEFASRTGELSGELAGQTDRARGRADTQRLRFALIIAVEAADALIKLAFRRDPEGDETVLAEAKVLIREYLQRHVES